MTLSSLHSLATAALAAAPSALAAANPYVPVPANCPSGDLIRPASGISPQESSFISTRKTQADAGLSSWLTSGPFHFPTNVTLPTLAIAYSGGSYRALLCAAGVRQALDKDDSNSTMAGLYQAMTYEAALSGGSWMLGSLAGSGYPTVSEQRDKVWVPNFESGLLLPDQWSTLSSYGKILDDVQAKQDAGYNTTVIDLWGRLQGYSFLSIGGEDDGGVSKHLSDFATAPANSPKNAPFPIITALGVYETTKDCPALQSAQFEFSPYEFGSWDASIKAFTPTKYLGTSLDNGKSNGSCVEHYDNLGYVTGTSSNIFAAALCEATGFQESQNGTGQQTDFGEMIDTLKKDLGKIHPTSNDDLYATYPNPFYKLDGVDQRYASQRSLYLSDGGSGDENVPIWPILHRKVDVLFVSDNSADTNDNYPDGRAVYNAFTQSQAEGLTRMPVIPPSATFIARGFNQKPTFFGCNATDKMTVLYFPNRNYTTDSGVSTTKLQFSEQDTKALIANGNHIADFNGTKDFSTCVACAVMKKVVASLPAQCKDCLAQYCYN